MYFGKLDIPEDILEAQENGTLVIFAGAGISTDSPAGLPNFKALAERIGKNSPLPFNPDSNEPLDRYLGQLEKKGVKVHELAKEILTQGDPLPNDYHTLIPKLFPNKAKLKIVTTNFDNLLLEGARKHWKDVLVYEAPALPVGDDFNGLVFLHGSVRQEPRRIVLTDADFSRAYLTEGWARRL